MKLLYNGDCLQIIPTMQSNSVDSLVTDPPAGISFMGNAWDSDKGGRDGWIEWMTEVARECLRVLKPGAHGLVWAIPRTSHWTAFAFERAGFEVRDIVTHIFGSGFPKSLDISKAIDKLAGAEREVIGPGIYAGRGRVKAEGWGMGDSEKEMTTAPATPEARIWQGFGTALKPASEHWILVRKPLGEKTVAKNVLKHGTGGLNIDACRVGTEPPKPRNSPKKIIRGGNFHAAAEAEKEMFHYNPTKGRFPANLIVDESAVAELDRQSGVSPSNFRKNPSEGADNNAHFGNSKSQRGPILLDDTGGASRFFYCAKASKLDRNEGLEGMPERNANVGDQRPSGNMSQRIHGKENRPDIPRANHHPTVKSTKLMEYLITLVTPPGGIVLDPFMGSGSTGKAALRKGFGFIGIEKETEYFEIAERRNKDDK